MSGGVAQMSGQAGQGSDRRSRLLPYAQLLRIPNVFTAMADIVMAALVTGALPGQALPFVFLMLASSCFYCAGMVWNDFFDFQQDLKERPFRPLPSSRIARKTALCLGAALMAVGLFAAILAGVSSDNFHSASLTIAVVLVISILLYDVWLKRTFLGPVSMGLCRFLNVLLGLTVTGATIPAAGVLLAAIVGIYIVGVTWFARREARISKQLELGAATLVMLSVLPLGLLVPVLGQQLARGPVWEFGTLGHIAYPYLLVAFGFWIGIPASTAIRNPQPKYVQAAVKRAILGLIALDTILAMSLAGTIGLLVLLLAPPALILGKRVYST